MNTSRMLSRRAGFTLIELLVAISLLLVLMGLGGAAAWKVMFKSVETRTLAEIRQLEGSMLTMNSKRGGSVAPCMGGASQSKGAALSRSDAFMVYVRARWPRQQMGGTYSEIRS